MRISRRLAVAAVFLVSWATTAAASVPPTGFEKTFVTSGVGSSTAVLVADVAGDSRADLIGIAKPSSSTVNAKISVYVQSDEGIPPAPSQTLTASALAGDVSVAAGDLNGDGQPDLAVAFADGYSFDGTPHPDIDIFRGGAGGSLPATPSQVVSPSPTVQDIAIADLTGDGLDDLFFSKGDAAPFTYSLRAQKPDGTLAPATTLGTDEAWFAVVGDVNDDGLVDWLPGGYRETAVPIYIQQPDHSFVPETVDLPPTISDVSLLDVNHDGRSDLVTYDLLAGTLTWATSAIGGGFDGPVSTSFDVGDTGWAPSAWSFGDLNSDGLQDVALFAWGSGVTYVLLQQASGGFAGACPFPAQQEAWAHTTSIGDVSGDLRDDIAMVDNQYADGTFWVDRQLTPPLALDSSLSLSSVGYIQTLKPISFTGALVSSGGGCFTAKKVAILRTDASDTTVQVGTATLTGTTFAFEDVPPAAGTYRYTAAWAGDDSHVSALSNEMQVDVVKRESRLKLDASKHEIHLGVDLTLTATLNGGDGVRSVTFIQEVGNKTHRLDTVRVNDKDVAKLTLSPSHTATYWAKYAGSGNFKPSASGESRVVVDAQVTASMTHYRRLDGKTAVYGCCQASIRYGVKPNQAASEVTIEFWVYASGSWHALSTGSAPLNAQSAGEVAFVIKNGKGYRFRAEVCFPGSRLNGGACAPDLFFRFE